MAERIFNLFLEVKEQTIYELGAVCHNAGGSDQTKLAFLQRNVLADLPRAKRYPIPERYRIVDRETGHHASSMSYESYLTLSELGKHLEVFEEIFADLKGPANPLMCITPIIDGKPQIDVVERL